MTEPTLPTGFTFPADKVPFTGGRRREFRLGRYGEVQGRRVPRVRGKSSDVGLGTEVTPTPLPCHPVARTHVWNSYRDATEDKSAAKPPEESWVDSCLIRPGSLLYGTEFKTAEAKKNQPRDTIHSSRSASRLRES